MNGLRPDAECRGDHGIDIQVAGGGGPGADAHGLVGEADMQGVLVGIGVDGDCGYSHVAAGAHHPNGDLAPVGYEDFVKHESCFRVGVTF